MRQGRCLLLVSLLLGSPLAAAQVPRYTAPQVLEKMLKAQEARAYFQADLVKREGPRGQRPTAISRGLLRAAPGGRARLDIKAPSPGLIVSDGRHLWVELPEVQQVMRYNASKLRESGNFFLDLPSSIRHYSKTSLCRLIVPGVGFDPARVGALELLPLRPDRAGFQRMRVWVDERRWVILRVLLDYNGTRSDVRFNHILTGPRVPDGENPFHYKPPKGFEVFDLDL